MPKALCKTSDFTLMTDVVLYCCGIYWLVAAPSAIIVTNGGDMEKKKYFSCLLE